MVSFVVIYGFNWLASAKRNGRLISHDQDLELMLYRTRLVISSVKNSYRYFVLLCEHFDI